MEGFPVGGGKKKQKSSNKQSRLASMSIWKQQGVGSRRTFPILLHAVGRRDLSSVNCSNTAHLRAVTFKPPLRLFWRNLRLT